MDLNNTKWNGSEITALRNQFFNSISWQKTTQTAQLEATSNGISSLNNDL
ncbi:MAG: hypothetical protein ACK5IJ_12115 [Mangrovibacterium sp.]